MSRPLHERFWRHVDFLSDPECWIWTGAKDDPGYGRIFLAKGKSGSAHRVAYELMVGPIPPGLHIDHLCRNPSCVNPEHLEAVTPAENMYRGLAPSTFNKAKTHCPQGHEYMPDSVYWNEGEWRRDGSLGPATRQCRTCARERSRRQYAAIKAERI